MLLSLESLSRKASVASYHTHFYPAIWETPPKSKPTSCNWFSHLVGAAGRAGNDFAMKNDITPRPSGPFFALFRGIRQGRDGAGKTSVATAKTTRAVPPLQPCCYLDNPILPCYSCRYEPDGCDALFTRGCLPQIIGVCSGGGPADRRCHFANHSRQPASLSR
jgi:hypothetical protein